TREEEDLWGNILAVPFLEYFEPLHTWISEDNLEKNLHVGWLTPDQCRHVTETNSTALFIENLF
ncbi:hypothetical protein DOY81_014566, partial [Sarcophaga bullata]